MKIVLDKTIDSTYHRDIKNKKNHYLFEDPIKKQNIISFFY